MIPNPLVIAILAAASLSNPPVPPDFNQDLDEARNAARAHRYERVIELLEPYNAIRNPEIRYATAAEIGRAYFHLGRYQEAHEAFRQAVRVRPQRAETAVYLEATSFLLGDRVQALTIFEELLKGGARDLYLAVTLPGEKRFLADPGVQTLLERYAIPIALDPQSGSLGGIGLGAARDEVVASFSVPLDPGNRRSLSASAGPATIWGFAFDTGGRLAEIVVQVQNLERYTPYRLTLAGQPDWVASPAATVAALGPADKILASVPGQLAMEWHNEGARLRFDFAEARAPRPPDIPEGSAVAQVIRLTNADPSSPDRMQP